jgi:hypothetical protein
MVCAFIASGSKIPYFAESSGALYSNPVQGPWFKDCHLIVALSSLAWINNTYFTNRDNYDSYTFYFYDTEPDAKKYPAKTDTTVPQFLAIKVNPKIFMDNLTGIWCGASSKRTEIWPVMYEKAFAKFCQFKFTDTMPFDKLIDSSVDPDFSSLPKGSDWGGNPVTVLKYFTGVPGKAKYFVCTDYKNADGTLNSATMYSVIKKLCNYRYLGIKSTLGAYNGAKIQYPAGAWTYLDENSAKTKTGISISYDQATLPADHCFSVLGVYENAGTQYIVLRNPYGLADADSTKYAVGPGPWIYPENKVSQICSDNSFSGTVISPASLDLTTADGIFALDVKLFIQYFEGFGYIST